MSQPDVQQQRSTRPAPQQPSQAQPRKVKFSVGTDYQVKDVIGEGAYGIVVVATRRRDGQKVAIKKVSRLPFLDTVGLQADSLCSTSMTNFQISPFDHVLFALRTLRELKLLKYFTMNQVSDNVSNSARDVECSFF